MTYIKYIILGIIQGITEPIPVSSSGHITLFKNLFNTNLFDSLNFEILANLGSFIAILWIFRNEIIDLIKSFFSFIFNKKKRKETKSKFLYCIYILISTIPVGIAGVLLKDKVEALSSNIKILGIAFLITALLLITVKNIKGTKTDKDINYFDAIIIGLFQMIAIFPGISRSGTVLVACLLCKMKKETALKYAFILYFPVSVGTSLIGVKDLINSTELQTLFLPYILGAVASLIVTYYSYKWLSSIVKKGNLWKFSIYCFILAIFIFIYFR